LLLLATSPVVLRAQSLSVKLEGDQLRISAPQLRFLAGDALQRLKDGASVTYTFELSATSGSYGGRIARETYRFAISYDLWEEKYAVARLDQSARSVSHLSAAAAEAWCLDALSLAAAALHPTDPFWISLEYRAEEPPRTDDGLDNSGFTLGGLIDIFSRRNQKQQPRGSREGGPFRVSDLRRASSVGNPGPR
jgi:hypothetical protein